MTAQLRVLSDYAKNNGYSVDCEYVDEAESGPIAARPQFRRRNDEGGNGHRPLPGQIDSSERGFSPPISVSSPIVAPSRVFYLWPSISPHVKGRTLTAGNCRRTVSIRAGASSGE